MQDVENSDILLIEDNTNDAELAVISLRNNNIKGNIINLRDGVEALDYLFKRGAYSGRGAGSKTKLILLDIKLPRIDGLEVLKVIKQDESTKLIPVVVFTSSNEEKDVINSYALGANSYIVKPLEYRQFEEVICDLSRYWINKNRFIA